MGIVEFSAVDRLFELIRFGDFMEQFISQQFGAKFKKIVLFWQQVYVYCLRPQKKKKTNTILS